jgi:hypothetical protein
MDLWHCFTSGHGICFLWEASTRICFLLIHSSLSSGPVSLPHQCVDPSMQRQMLRCTFLTQPHVAWVMWGLCAPMNHCGCILIGTLLGGVELQRWPMTQGTSQASGPGGEGVRTAHEALRYHPWWPSSGCHASAPLLPLPLLPSLCSLSNSQAQAANLVVLL